MQTFKLDFKIINLFFLKTTDNLFEDINIFLIKDRELLNYSSHDLRCLLSSAHFLAVAKNYNEACKIHLYYIHIYSNNNISISYYAECTNIVSGCLIF